MVSMGGMEVACIMREDGAGSFPTSLDISRYHDDIMPVVLPPPLRSPVLLILCLLLFPSRASLPCHLTAFHHIPKAHGKPPNWDPIRIPGTACGAPGPNLCQTTCQIKCHQFSEDRLVTSNYFDFAIYVRQHPTCQRFPASAE